MKSTNCIIIKSLSLTKTTHNQKTRKLNLNLISLLEMCLSSEIDNLLPWSTHFWSKENGLPLLDLSPKIRVFKLPLSSKLSFFTSTEKAREAHKHDAPNWILKLHNFTFNVNQNKRSWEIESQRDSALPSQTRNEDAVCHCHDSSSTMDLVRIHFRP